MRKWEERLKSRKFIMAIAVFIATLIPIFSDNTVVADKMVAMILMLADAVIYMICETNIDLEAIGKEEKHETSADEKK